MKKFRGIVVKRIDKTVEPDSKGIFPRSLFRVKVANDIVPTHRILMEDRTYTL